MLKKILLAVLVLVAAFFAFVATRPDTFHIERTAVVHAPSDVVYARVDDFHRWRKAGARYLPMVMSGLVGNALRTVVAGTRVAAT